MNCNAYWIHISGEIIPVNTTHIAEVVKMPEHFGYTRERIEVEYAATREPVGFEGKARQVIMTDLIVNHGWVRVRYTPRSDSWVVEMKKLTGEISQLLKHLFSCPEIVNEHPHSTIKITELDNAGCLRNHHTTAHDICKIQV